jgi:hypothetical protein
MTSSEDLSAEAKHLLRQAKGADRATRSEVASSVHRFRSTLAQRPAWQRGFRPAPARRATPWAVLVAVLSGTLAAYATVGQSLGLPLPGWWPELATLPVVTDTTAERSPGAAHANDARSPAVVSGAASVSGAATGGSGAASVGMFEPPPVVAAGDVVSSRTGANSTPAVAGRGRIQSSSHASAPRVSQAEAPPRATEPGAAIVSPLSPSVTPGPLAQEVQTITAARDALNAGDCALAARHLDVHRLQFPKGALSEERQALSAICQCRRGASTAAAAAYVSRRPNSPLARRVASECDLDVH